MPQKPPAMPLYVRDFMQSKRVRLMRLDQVGMYVFMLCEAWDNDPVGYLPEGFETWRLARAESKEDFEARGGQFILECFRRNNQGRLYSPRMIEIRRDQRRRSKQKRRNGMLGSEARWHSHGKANGKADGKSVARAVRDSKVEGCPSSSFADSSVSSHRREKQPTAPKAPVGPPPQRAYSDEAIRLFAAYYHQPPAWGKGHYVQLANLREVRPDLIVTEFARRFQNFLTSPEEFHRQQGGSLAFFCSHFDQFILPVTARKNGTATDGRNGRHWSDEAPAAEAKRNPAETTPKGEEILEKATHSAPANG